MILGVAGCSEVGVGMGGVDELRVGMGIVQLEFATRVLDCVATQRRVLDFVVVATQRRVLDSMRRRVLHSVATMVLVHSVATMVLAQIVIGSRYTNFVLHFADSERYKFSFASGK
jgi:hypothetical protein